MKYVRRFFALLLLFALSFTVTHAKDSSAANLYRLQPGDVLQISVWKEEDMNNQVIIRPDGRINFPLMGEAQAAGKSVEDLRQLIAEKLKKYIPDPVVSVSIQQLSGNVVYVIGKVNRPGPFQLVRNVDAMQALSMAGGMSTYAAVNNIKILRRERGKLRAIPFEYGDVAKASTWNRILFCRPATLWLCHRAFCNGAYSFSKRPDRLIPRDKCSDCLPCRMENRPHPPLQFRLQRQFTPEHR